MHYLLATALAGLPFLVTAWPAIYDRQDSGVNYTSIFASGLSSGASIHYTSDADYNTTTIQPWSYWAEPTYSVTIKPATDADVQYIVSNQLLRSYT
jgi:hypothetical protein